MRLRVLVLISFVLEIKMANITETTGEHKQQFWLVLRTEVSTKRRL